MLQSFVFNDGKLVGQDLDADALKIVRGDKGLLIWVNLCAPNPAEVSAILEDLFSFHPLAIEDCLATSREPKVEDYEAYLFLVMHAVAFNKEEHFLTNDISFFIGKTFLVTHEPKPSFVIRTMIERIQKNALPVAKGIDRLTHLILDTLVDAYQPVLNDLTKEVHALEDDVFLKQNTEPTIIREFRERKRELTDLQQIVRPQRDVISRLAKGEFKIIRPVMLPYFRDLLGNFNSIDTATTSLGDQLYLTLDVFLNKASYETNEIIKVLTLMTAVTTPTVIIGTWYGQNFADMPEYKLPYAYPFAFGVNIVLTVALVVWLRKKRWL